MPDDDRRLGITQLQCKRLGQIETIHRLDAEQKQELIFSSRPFVLCGLRLRRPPADTLLHTRRNGKYILQVQAHPEHGLPFGQDRLIPIWVSTLAVRQRSRHIRFRAASDVLECFGLPRNGKHYHRLISGFKRVFTSTVYFGTDDQRSGNQVWEFARFAFLDHMRLWNAQKQSERPHCREDNTITLSEPFWHEINEHPLPADLNVVRGLANAPGCLDLYLWLVWRCYKLKERTDIPLFGHNGLCTQLGVDQYLRDRDLKRTLLRWLRVIRTFWNECPASVEKHGKTLRLSPARVIHQRLYA
jgi:hypothetical protein